MTHQAGCRRQARLICLSLAVCSVIVCQFDHIFLPELVMQWIKADRTLKEQPRDEDNTLSSMLRAPREFKELQATVTPSTADTSNHGFDSRGHSNPSEKECPEPRDVYWEFESFRKDLIPSRASKRLLIGLYSGYGVYSKLLEKTAYINRAYANLWEHDVILVQGAAMRVAELDGRCEPPAYRATYNKIPLLEYALDYKDQYDQLLILDTDALIYNFDFDVTQLLPEEKLLAAQRVKIVDKGKQTWDVNAGVTLWNLHHPRVEELAKTWKRNLKHGLTNGFHPSNDQFHLHTSLREGGFESQILALDEEFNYGHGTIVKHFIRKPEVKQWGHAGILENRESRIDGVIENLCQVHGVICDDVVQKTYVY